MVVLLHGGVGCLDGCLCGGGVVDGFDEECIDGCVDEGFDLGVVGLEELLVVVVVGGCGCECGWSYGCDYESWFGWCEYGVLVGELSGDADGGGVDEGGGGG